MEKISILWIDDEIDLLKPHILFLKQKGYNVDTANSGTDALDMLKTQVFDIIFLDENMPGLSGIETLEKIKSQYVSLPVVMITKSEEESIMEDAIGSNIADYLIKPVNPNQILLALKKSLELKKIVSEKTTSAYQQEFGKLGSEISANLIHSEWADLYKRLIQWELKLEKSTDESIFDVLVLQKNEANTVFCKYIEKNYKGWVSGSTTDRPVMSHTLMREKIFPWLQSTQPVFLILIDNLRYDQWKVLQPLLDEFYYVENEDHYYSILPTTTQYARNALFSGLLPSEIARKYPNWWIDEEDDGTKNQFEEELLGEQLKRFGRDIKFSYNKILNYNAGKKLVEVIPNLLGNKLNVIVYNFVDMLSHARTEMEIIRELADDESAYRSITNSWFLHSPLFEMLRNLSEKQVTLIITTDHGSVRVNNPVKIVGDKNTNTNLRYKNGRSLSFNTKEAFEVRNPGDIFLPRTNVSSSYVFCRKTDFFAYPNNFNYYANYYRNTFQHGGISLEEMIVPFVVLKSK